MFGHTMRKAEQRFTSPTLSLSLSLYLSLLRQVHSTLHGAGVLRGGQGYLPGMLEIVEAAPCGKHSTIFIRRGAGSQSDEARL